jgi:hypothetical protein
MSSKEERGDPEKSDLDKPIKSSFATNLLSKSVSSNKQTSVTAKATSIKELFESSDEDDDRSREEEAEDGEVSNPRHSKRTRVKPVRTGMIDPDAVILDEEVDIDKPLQRKVVSAEVDDELVEFEFSDEGFLNKWNTAGKKSRDPKDCAVWTYKRRPIEVETIENMVTEDSSYQLIGQLRTQLMADVATYASNSKNMGRKAQKSREDREVESSASTR